MRTTTFLDIYIDDGLEWGDHNEHIIKKVSSGSYAIRTAKKILSVENLRKHVFQPCAFPFDIWKHDMGTSMYISAAQTSHVAKKVCEEHM